MCALVAVLVLAAGASSAPATAPVGGINWSANATAFRGQNNLEVTYKCPKAGALGYVYGTGVYTDDSSVCSAAVNAGLITLANGGTVTIKILPGKPAYSASTKHGVTTSAYGPWSGSYSFVVVPAGPILDGGRTWTATAASGKSGNRYRYSCPPNGKLAPVYGSAIFAAKSSVCSAAVFSGQISATQGGNVVIAVGPGRSSYAGGVKNGVTTQASASTPTSFTFTTA